MAEELGLEELQAHALNNIGISRVQLGDDGGFEELERSIEIADAINSVESARSYGNLASGLADLGELDRAWEALAQARRLTERFGLDDWILWLRGESAYPAYHAGEWDEAIEILDGLIEVFTEHPFWMETPCRGLRAKIRLARGDEAGARQDLERALELADAAKDPQVLWPVQALAACLFASSDPDRAGALLTDLLAAWVAHGWQRASEAMWISDAVVALAELGREADFLAAVEKAYTAPSAWRRAAVALVSGDPLGAGQTYAEIGSRPDEAYARLRTAELLLREGRRAEADVELEQALAFWRSVGATRYIRQGEALLAEAS
jgi:tetratricopeptide (TPR) repeat protein